MLRILGLHRDIALVLSGMALSADDDSDSIGSESSGSGLSDESSGSGDEISSLSCVYSSSESSSDTGRGRRRYRRAYRDAYGEYNPPPDYRQIPRGRRRY